MSRAERAERANLPPARLMSEQNAPVARERRAEKCPARLGSLNHARRSARSARCQPCLYSPTSL